ncbi:hypothetical protein ACPPVO_44710 [Dactylosporangium sp. McL0621]|uniref:hypothetical protein n=1 Tax=Dactylosporangium sp. McL0621 TaxID=3415678 RepID=UPI003CF3B259
MTCRPAATVARVPPDVDLPRLQQPQGVVGEPGERELLGEVGHRGRLVAPVPEPPRDEHRGPRTLGRVHGGRQGDEPTSGLDPLMEQAFQQCVRERRDDGATVLLSSHILGEVEALADRVSIIRRGRTVTTGSLSELRRHTRTSVHAVTARPPDGLDRAEGVADCTRAGQDGTFDVRFTIDADHLDATIGRLHAARLLTLTVTPPSLDALFLRSYEEAVR